MNCQKKHGLSFWICSTSGSAAMILVCLTVLLGRKSLFLASRKTSDQPAWSSGDASLSHQFLQTLFLHCLLFILDDCAEQVQVNCFGFSRGHCVLEVASIIQNILSKCNLWKLRALMAEGDVVAAFDHMKQSDVSASLGNHRVHPRITANVLCEMQGVNATVRLQDVEVKHVEMSKSGRQGGVKTPSLWNYLIDDSLREVDQYVLDVCFTFELDDMRIPLLVWADNIWVITTRLDLSCRIMCLIIEALAEKGLFWKPDSLKHISFIALQNRDFVWDHNECTFTSRAVTKMLVLGIMIDQKATAQIMVEHRMRQADKHFAGKKRRLCKQNDVTLHDRVDCFYRTTVRCLLWGAGLWVLTKGLLLQLRVWENEKLRSMLNKKRKSDDTYVSWVQWCSHFMDRLLCKWEISRLCELCIREVYCCVGILVRSIGFGGKQSVIRKALDWRSLAWCASAQEIGLVIDSRNQGGWRTAHSGHAACWEDILVRKFGSDWKNVAADSKSCSKSRDDFVDFVFWDFN